MKTYLANAFSLSMLPPKNVVISVEEINVEKAREALLSGFESAIGHEATAQFLTYLLGFPVPIKRVPIQLNSGDALIVFQLLSRLPEGKILTVEEMRQIPYKFFAVKVL